MIVLKYHLWYVIYRLKLVSDCDKSYKVPQTELYPESAFALSSPSVNWRQSSSRKGVLRYKIKQWQPFLQFDCLHHINIRPNSANRFFQSSSEFISMLVLCDRGILYIQCVVYCLACEHIVQWISQFIDTCIYKTAPDWAIVLTLPQICSVVSDKVSPGSASVSACVLCIQNFHFISMHTI